MQCTGVPNLAFYTYLLGGAQMDEAIFLIA